MADLFARFSELPLPSFTLISDNIVPGERWGTAQHNDIMGAGVPR